MIHEMRPAGCWTDGLLKLIDECLGWCITGLEIGAYTGESTRMFMESGKFYRLYVLDAWQDGLDPDDQTTVLSDLALVEKLWDDRMQAYQDHLIKLKGDSRELHTAIPDHSLDFIYHDACHSRDALCVELELYRPKLRDGGIVAGHDYNASYPGVAEAVQRIYGKPDRIYEDFSWVKFL